MRDNTFTPGPWCIYPETDGTEICAVTISKGLPIRQLIAHPVRGDNWINNARLIAAAPDMYDALWETIELSDRNLTEAGRTPECQRVYDIVRAALAKAEGE